MDIHFYFIFLKIDSTAGHPPLKRTVHHHLRKAGDTAHNHIVNGLKVAGYSAAGAAGAAVAAKVVAAAGVALPVLVFVPLAG